jgi:ABC-type nitrate/sulfonate/bicarbonate transport system ATPase subunit
MTLADFVLVLGDTGVGKSTLINLLSGVPVIAEKKKNSKKMCL